jgi:hypothetical protein
MSVWPLILAPATIKCNCHIQSKCTKYKAGLQKLMCRRSSRPLLTRVGTQHHHDNFEVNSCRQYVEGAVALPLAPMGHRPLEMKGCG